MAQQALPCLAFPTRVICHYCLFHPPLSPAFPRQGCHLAFLLGCYLSHRGCDKPSGGGLEGVKRGENMIKIWCMKNISKKKIIKRIPLPQQTKPKSSIFPASSFLSVMKMFVSIQILWTVPLPGLPHPPPRPSPYIPVAMSSPLSVPSQVTGTVSVALELFFLPLSQ